MSNASETKLCDQQTIVSVTALSGARAGDEDAFRELIDPYRAELHCYRILGSLHQPT